jgi:hypothetical protein
MEDEREPQTWQELLQRLIENPKEKERLVEQTHIQAVTLTRWIKGISKPHTEKMRTLLKAIPRSHAHTFAQLLSVDFPSLLLEDADSQSVPSELPLEFYRRVFKVYANAQSPLYPQVLRDLIFQQMIKHFDPDSLGLAIRIARCFWHRDEKQIRSLQVIEGVGTPPWSKDLSQGAIFLGAESPAGMAVMKCRLVVASRQAEDSARNCVRWGEHEQSMLAYPLMYQARVAGCLLVASTRADAFSEVHHRLIERYAQVMALTFEPSAFFDWKSVALRIIPPYASQEPLFRQFHQRALQTAQRQSISLSEAQVYVWQDIEEELIQLAVKEL